VAALWFTTGVKMPPITFTLNINAQPAPGSQIYLGNPATQVSSGSPLTFTRQ
jgi:hypothetical protein